MSILDLVYPVGSVVFGKHPSIGKWELLPRGYVIETTDQELSLPYSLRQKQLISQDCLAKRIVSTNERGEHSHENRNLTFSHFHEVLLPPHYHTLSTEEITITGSTQQTYTQLTDDENQITNKAYQLSTNQGWVWVGSTGNNSGGSSWSAPNGTVLYSHRHIVPSTPISISNISGVTDFNSETLITTRNKELEVELPMTVQAGSHKHVVEIGLDEPEEFYNKAIILQAFIRVS